LPASEQISTILNTVWGFDLNPLAVQAARVNFLIAIADLVASAKAQVELPVLLADAVYSPAHAPQANVDFVEYRVGSAQSDLNIILPWAMAYDRVRLDEVFEIFAEEVEDEHPYADVERRLLAVDLLSAEEADAWREALGGTYNAVLDLHRKAWNGIWFRIVRNFFWSAVAGEFDVVIGNPPWVRWSALPEMYRERIKPTCEQYDIFSKTPFHGGNELDISGMLTYTVGDKWLRQGGHLVFLITQTHFQSPSSQGFRSFRINDQAGFVPVEIDDLKRLKPFPKVANATAIMHLRKVPVAVLPTYPVPYYVWEKAPGASANIPDTLTPEDVKARVTIKKWEATPVAGGNSPWAILAPGRFVLMNRLRGESNWIAGRKGITTDLNGVYMVRVTDQNKKDGLVQVETRPEAGRRDIGPARRFWVEPDMLYPLLKGASDFSACHVHVDDELYVFVPNTGINQADYVAASAGIDKLKGTKAFFKAFKPQLQTRSTYKQRQPKAPYYVVYNSGSYTFAPYKVVWAEQSSTFESAVFTDSTVPGFAGTRPFVPDHKVYFSDFQDEDTAYFVCGLLNSSLVREYVQSHTIQIQVSNIFKHLSIPRFESANTDHKTLVELCKAAHQAADAAKRQKKIADMDDVAAMVLAVQ